MKAKVIVCDTKFDGLDMLRACYTRATGEYSPTCHLLLLERKTKKRSTKDEVTCRSLSTRFSTAGRASRTCAAFV